MLASLTLELLAFGSVKIHQHMQSAHHTGHTAPEVLEDVHDLEDANFQTQNKGTHQLTASTFPPVGWQRHAGARAETWMSVGWRL